MTQRLNQNNCLVHMNFNELITFVKYNVDSSTFDSYICCISTPELHGISDFECFFSSLSFNRKVSILEIDWDFNISFFQINLQNDSWIYFAVANWLQLDRSDIWIMRWIKFKKRLRLYKRFYCLCWLVVKCNDS